MRKSKSDPALIPALVNEGFSDKEIADRMGWTVGTLRVRCSQLKISLVRRRIAVPRATLDQLQHRARMMGTSACVLAAELLETIARDGLFDAVLDKEEAELDSTATSMH